MKDSNNKKIYNSSEANNGFDELFNNLIWLTTKEAASYLRKSVNAIHTLVSRGKLRARKVHGRLYFKKSELHDLINSSWY